jgi:rfaE bifunctional protein nucleotidyltransferase chain/domain
MLTSASSLTRIRQEARQRRLPLVLVNGCFDLLHAGHAALLQAAKENQPGGALLAVAVNSDASVRQIKGPRRPIIGQEERLALILALRWVDFGFVFDELRVTWIIQMMQPDIWVKGGAYTLDTIDPSERAAAEGAGAEIQFIPYAKNLSTTSIIRRCQAAAPD